MITERLLIFDEKNVKSLLFRTFRYNFMLLIDIVHLHGRRLLHTRRVMNISQL